MKLELALIVAQPSPRRVEAWLPHLPIARMTGPSLAALRDDLALAVMLKVEQSSADELRRYQLAPHLRIRQVDIALKLEDAETGKTVEKKATVPVLLEKWPADDFWVVTPTRVDDAIFAIPDPDRLVVPLTHRIARYLEENEHKKLEDFASKDKQRVDILEVDADPPTVLPRTVKEKARPAPKARAREEKETPAQREEKRNRARLLATTLRAATQNLSHRALDGTLERAFGREALVRQILAEVLGRDDVALVLVGPSGAGKTALIHEVVRRLSAEHTSAGSRRDVWRIDGGRFISGQSYVGQWEQRARDLVRELVDTGDVLCADDLTSLAYAGRAGHSRTNLTSYLIPPITRGELAVIGECTPERWALLRDEEPGFANLFHVVPVPAIDAVATLPVLLGVLRDLESEPEGDFPPRLSPAALEILVTAAARLRPHEAYPGRAVRLLHTVLAGPGTVEAGVRAFGADDVWGALRAETGLPDSILGAAPPVPRDQVEKQLGALVAGQPEAVAAMADAVVTLQAGLGDADKPLATYLFVGPTGVGKTESAKALARVLFGSPDRMVRFDMSELVSPASLARLVGEPGAPDGELTSALRAQPLRVVLFDEIEKAHPRVFDALLQLLGEGRLTDAAGRTADARQAVIVMTSNLGVREAASRPGFMAAGDEARQHYLSAVRAFFRPEFFNRIDRVVPFAPLSRPALRVVVEHALSELLSRRGIQRANVLVDVEPELLGKLVEEAHDPRYGARPIRRALERRLTVPLAQHLVTQRGDDLALVELFHGASGMGLAVRLLQDAPLALDEDGTEGWSLTRLAAEVSALRARVDRLGGLADLAARLDALDENALAGVDFEETIRAPEHLVMNHENRRAGHKGLRRRPGISEHRVQMPREALLRSLRPEVATLRDAVELAEHRARSRVETGTLFIDGAHAEVKNVVAALAELPLALEAVAPESASLRALAAEAPGLREMLAPFLGWAVVEQMTSDGVGRSLPIRLTLLAGGVASYQELLLGERAARRRGETPAPGAVVFRPKVRYGPLVHVATGRPVAEARAVLAAYLRGRRAR